MGSRILVRGDDGILAAQRRLRELGRIRTGWSEPYTKDGREYRRPVRSKTIVLTAKERGILDAAAEQWGGQVERWQPQGNNPEVWRVVTDQSSIEAILPPGDPLNQTMEMWSGGGCTRRCDGIQEKLSGKDCLCFAQFGPDFHQQKPVRGVPQVCKPTSRLTVFLDLPDLGTFRVETHSYYAMLEMAATVDMIRGAVKSAMSRRGDDGPEPSIPIRLRIDPRTRLFEGKSTPYPVIVVELLGRGVVAQILSGTVDGLAIEAPARAAIAAVPHDVHVEVGGARVDESAPSRPAVVQQPAGPQANGGVSVEELVGIREQIFSTANTTDAQALWHQVAELELTREQRAALTQDFWAQKRRLQGRGTEADEALAAAVLWPSTAEPAAEDPAGVDFAATQEAAAAPAAEEREPDKVTTWMQIMAVAGRLGWDATRTADEMVAAVGKEPMSADGWAMAQFLEHLQQSGANA